MGAGLRESAGFSEVVSRTYPWAQTYATGEYLDLLRTYSDHRSLGPVRREELLDCLGELLDREFGGRLRKAYLTELTVARRIGRGIPSGG